MQLSLIKKFSLEWIKDVAEAAVVNPNGTKTHLANSGSKFFINGKPAVIKELIKLRNPPFRLIILLVVPFS